MARHTRTITLEQFSTNDTSWFVLMDDHVLRIIHDLDLDREIREALMEEEE